MKEPRWVTRIVVDAVHFNQLREHGGLPGIRDEGALESALARPRNKWSYNKRSDLADLAAAYAFGLARNHPYRDGKKRIAFLTLLIFLGLNDHWLSATEGEVVSAIVALAGGKLSESQLAKWIRLRLIRD
jgi:death-on-curing protein